MFIYYRFPSVSLFSPSYKNNEAGIGEKTSGIYLINPVARKFPFISTKVNYYGD